MIKGFFLLPLCLLFTLSASAQWWKKTKPVVVRPPLLADALNLSFNLNKNSAAFARVDSLPRLKMERSQFSYDAAEKAIMKSLYHTLRFHMSAESIVSFNSLIALYLEQNRYSEAKWYLLQINYLAHQANDNVNVIASLVNLGMLKSDIGEFAQAKQDLTDAVAVASALGRLTEVADINKKLLIIEHKRVLNVKNDIRYAELPEDKKN